jgi:hypothetical protein
LPEDFMNRLIFAAALSGLLAVACAPKEGAPPAETTSAPATAPAPAAAPSPAPDTRVATMTMICGAESLRVAFEETRAVVVNADGGNTELALLPPTPDSEPGVSTYTNGTMTFAKSGRGDSPAVIRFARGRMAFQDCAIAQN